MQTIFFLDVADWGKRQLYAVCLNLLEPIVHWNITCIKTCRKSNQEGEWNGLDIMNRTLLNRPKSIKFCHVHKLKLWIVFYVEECLYAYKVCTEILFHIGNYKKLQHNNLRQSLNQVPGMLWDNFNFLLHLTCLLLSLWQVLSKAKET